MTEYSSRAAASSVDNLVERAAQSADKALDITRRATGAAIDSVADTVHGLRDRASPMLDQIVSPFDAMTEHTRRLPLRSLLMAAAAGAGLMVLVTLLARWR